MITQEQYNVLRQPVRNLNIKIDLINENDVVVSSFEGITIDGNITFSSNSTYRRSGNITMVFDKKYNILPSPESKIWYNKKIGIYIGLKNYLGEVVWFDMGRFAISDVELNFGTVDKTMSCSLLDYCAFLDGTLSGILSHKIVIDEGTPISDAVKTILSDLVKISIEELQIDETDLKLPYTIEKSAGNTIYDLVSEIMELYMGWTWYFNKEGIFIVEKIRDKKGDPIIESFDNDEKDFTLNSTSRVDFSHVRNSIYVWGRQLDDGTQVKWNYKNKWMRSSYEELDDLTEKQKGDICYIANEDMAYMWNGENWEMLDFVVLPMFNIESIGEKTYVYNDDKIFNEEQAKLRAEYELVNYSNFAETIDFNVVPLYSLRPEQKIYINIDDLIKGEYLINDISIPLNIEGSMNINCHKLYY